MTFASALFEHQLRFGFSDGYFHRLPRLLRTHAIDITVFVLVRVPCSRSHLFSRKGTSLTVFKTVVAFSGTAIHLFFAWFPKLEFFKQTSILGTKSFFRNNTSFKFAQWLLNAQK